MPAIRKILEHKYFPLAIALIAFLVFLPTINYGLILDDLIHRAMLVDADHLPDGIYQTGVKRGSPGKLSTALFDLFAFCGDEEILTEGWNYGTMPWWTPKSVKAAMWRPLSSFTHWVDYRLFPDSARLMRIHHLLWFSGVIFLIAVLYRRLIGPGWIAALAVIFFLVDENNFFPIMLIAHRNSFLALVFGLLCTLCHHHWRTSGSPAAAVAAPILLLLSLFSAEAGIATFAFILAYAIALEKGSLARRAVTIIPAVGTIIIWRLLYNSLGYGVSGIGLYIDPVNEPVRFILVMLERFPVMLFGVFSPVSPDLIISMSPSVITGFIFISIAFLLLLVVVMLPLLINNRLAGFFALATVFAVVPFCACFVGGRNLLFASVPGFALIAIFIADVFKKAEYLPKNLICRIVIWIFCIGLLLTHLPGALLGKIISQKMTASALPTGSGVPKELIENVRPDQHFVIINAPFTLSVAYLPFERAYKGFELPGSIRALVPALRPLKIQRTDEKILVIKSKSGDFFSCGRLGPIHPAYIFKNFSDLFMAHNQEFRQSDIITLPDMAVKIVSVDQNARPTELSFTFARPLEDKAFCFYWFNWNWLRYERFEVPSVGQTVELPGPSYVKLSAVMEFFKQQLTKP